VFAASQLPDDSSPGTPSASPDESPPDGSPPDERPTSAPGDRVLEPVRMWVAIEPAVAAHGPLDPAIPVIRVILEHLAGLGYCAATTGPDAPPDRVVVSAWAIDPAGARPIGLRGIAVPGVRSGPTEGLFAPDGPGAGSAAEWPTGRYVFRVIGVSMSYERWFGVDVQRWTRGGDVPSSSPPDASIVP
jgi:hypothetical protein